jgi:hypothetical protein
MTDREACAARNQERSLAAFLAKKAEFDALLAGLIPIPTDQNPCAQLRRPMDMMRQG